MLSHFQILASPRSQSDFSLLCLFVSHITGERVNAYSWKLQDRFDLVQGTVCNILGMFDSNPCIRDFFFYFQGQSVSVSNITESGKMDFHEIFRTGQI